MKKTGESYTSARRHILQQGESPLPPRAAQSHFAGSVPGAAALRILLAHSGVRFENRPLSEAMTFGIAGAIGIGVFQFHYERENFSSFFLSGRHSWHDDLPYLRAALDTFGFGCRVLESGGKKAADKNLRDALAGGAPCVAFVDFASLPHRAAPDQMRGGGYHVVTVYAIDKENESAWIGDSTDRPIAIALSDLTESRLRIKKFKSRVLTLETGAEPELRQLQPRELEHLVRAGLERCIAQLESPVMQSGRKNFRLEAISDWASRLHGSDGKDAWQRVFAPGPNLWRGLVSIYETIELYGTGGGLCRYHMADFLEEAGQALESPALAELSERYRALGSSWSDLARAALPAGTAEFDEARSLLDKKSELLHDGPDPEPVRETWAALHELELRAGGSFPISKSDAEELCRVLKTHATAIHLEVVAAIEDIRNLLARKEGL
ncbi:MAG: DUF4872 domain-containing protein [Planctomycetota bacterium]